jgi:hypothetical protein
MVEPTPPFGRLLRQEVKDAFGSSRAAVLTVLRFPRAWKIPCLALVLVLGLVCAPGERSSLWGYWLHVTVCSAPLYAIAHDWGRFSAITFWVALVLTYHARAQGFEDSPAAPAVAASTSSSMALRNAGVILGLTAFLVLGVKANSAVYRYMGMSLRSLVVIPIFAVPWLGWRLVLRWRSSRGQQV